MSILANVIAKHATRALSDEQSGELIRDLDEHVHDYFSAHASDVNNGGLERQISTLIEHEGVDAALEMMRELGLPTEALAAVEQEKTKLAWIEQCEAKLRRIAVDQDWEGLAAPKDAAIAYSEDCGAWVQGWIHVDAIQLEKAFDDKQWQRLQQLAD